MDVVRETSTADGYNGGTFGDLDDNTIGTTAPSLFTVAFLKTETGQGDDHVTIAFLNAVEFLPRGSVFNFGGTEFTANADSEDPQSTVIGLYRWPIPTNFAWIEGQKVTVSVKPGNFAATGQPGISGTAQVGQTLTATTSGISDADGKTKAEDGDTGYAYTYQWILVDGNTETDISGETSSTYTPSSSDVGKTIKVRVSFTDDLDNAEGPLTSEQTAAVTAVTVVTVAVSIAANHDSIGAGLEDLVFTLTRQGATTDALEAMVTIVQDRSWLGTSDLSHTVTFVAGSATATLTLAASRFSFDPDTSGDLTATVSGAGIAGGEATVEMVSTADPPITVSYDMSSYTFAEDAADVNIYVVATLDPAYPRAPSRSFYIAFSTNSDTATSPEDFVT